MVFYEHYENPSVSGIDGVEVFGDAIERLPNTKLVYSNATVPQVPSRGFPRLSKSCRKRQTENSLIPRR